MIHLPKTAMVQQIHQRPYNPQMVKRNLRSRLVIIVASPKPNVGNIGAALPGLGHDLPGQPDDAVEGEGGNGVPEDVHGSPHLGEEVSNHEDGSAEKPHSQDGAEEEPRSESLQESRLALVFQRSEFGNSQTGKERVVSIASHDSRFTP